MKQLQEISKYSIRKLAKGTGALLISSVLIFNVQNSASAEETHDVYHGENKQVVTNANAKAQQSKDTTEPEIQSITIDKRQYAPGEIAIATIVVKDESDLTDVSIGFTNKTQVGAPPLSGVASKENIEKIGDDLWKVTLQILIPEKMGDTSFDFAAAIVDDSAENGATIAPELAPSSINTKNLSFKVVNSTASGIDNELPQFDSITIDKQAYAPGDVIKAQLKIADKSALKEVSLGFENYPDNGLRGLSKFADLSNVQRNSEGQWVVNIDIPVPNDLEEGSYKFSHISATDEYENAFGLIDAPQFETKFHSINFKVVKGEKDKEVVTPTQPKNNDQNQDAKIINTNTSEPTKPNQVEQDDNNANMHEHEQSLGKDANEAGSTPQEQPLDKDKSAQNNDSADNNVQNNSKEQVEDKVTDNADNQLMPEASAKSIESEDNNVAIQNEPPKATDENSEGNKALSTDKQHEQQNDATTAHVVTPQDKGDTSNVNNSTSTPQNKKAHTDKVQDVDSKSQVADQKMSDKHINEPKKDLSNKSSKQPTNKQSQVTSKDKKENPAQTNSKSNKNQRAQDNTQTQSTVDYGNGNKQPVAKQHNNDKTRDTMSKQASATTKDTTDVNNKKVQNTTAKTTHNKVVASNVEGSKKASSKENTDKTKQQAPTKNKVSKKEQNVSSAKQLPKTGIMDNMRDYLFIGVLMTMGIAIIMLRKFFVLK